MHIAIQLPKHCGKAPNGFVPMPTYKPKVSTMGIRSRNGNSIPIYIEIGSSTQDHNAAPKIIDTEKNTMWYRCKTSVRGFRGTTFS